jgi:hypothetical protein
MDCPGGEEACSEGEDVHGGKTEQWLTFFQLDFRIAFWAWVMFISLDLNRKNINRAISDNMLKDLGW